MKQLDLFSMQLQFIGKQYLQMNKPAKEKRETDHPVSAADEAQMTQKQKLDGGGC